MTKVRLLCIILIALLFTACQFNQTTSKDLTTGAYSRGDGLGSDDVKIQINGETVKRNSFVYGERVYFIFNDIKGLTKVDGKSFPGLSMYVVNKEKDTLLAEPNLMGNLKKGTGLSPLQLRANLVAALPVSDGYKVLLNIWDTKGDGTFIYELPFEIRANKLLDITVKNMEYENIYLWNETNKYAVNDTHLKIDEKYILISEKVKGLKSIDGKVYPKFCIELEDSKGNKILSDENVLKKYENEGVDAEGFAEGQVPITISFTKGKIFNPCKLKATLTDKNSSNRIDISGELTIKP